MKNKIRYILYGGMAGLLLLGVVLFFAIQNGSDAEAAMAPTGRLEGMHSTGLLEDVEVISSGDTVFISDK